MRIGLMLPDAGVPVREPRLDQRILGLKTRFGAETEVVIIQPDGAPASDSGHFDHLAWFWETAPEAPQRGYRVSSIGRVLPLKGIPLGAGDEGSVEAHPFARFVPSEEEDPNFASFQYFPYGYTFRFPGLGATDSFGHRISQDLRSMERRDPDQRLIACFGASAVWGTSVLPHQCFPARLQSVLDESAAERGSNLKFTVLNFGVPGAVMLNAMERFILFAAHLKPDIVIFHDGVNDFYYANTSSPRLVADWDIAYQQNLELWAEALHRRGDAAFRVHVNGPTREATGVAPLDILRSYLRRKREAAKLAQGFGARVISALQPYSGSKRRLTANERARVDEWIGPPPRHQSEIALISGLYETISRHRPSFGADLELNFHEIFGDLREEADHFADVVHLDCSGENVVAERYHRAIWSLMQ